MGKPQGVKKKYLPNCTGKSQCLDRLNPLDQTLIAAEQLANFEMEGKGKHPLSHFYKVTKWMNSH